MEGYLYADTYELPLENTVEALVTRATNRTLKALAGLTIPEDGQLSDMHEVVTLASIVQREAVLSREMPLIASIYLNRLRKGMKLQADPTMTYAPETWSQAASPAHRKNKANIFNTYAREGLPPGPIGAVGEHALRAVLRPAESEFLFFVALGDGTGGHAFSRTFEEHRRNVDNYRKARKSQR